MSAFFTIGKALFDEGQKFLNGRKQQSEEEQEQAIIEELRLMVYTGRGNGLRFTVASEEDRRCSIMVAKKLLVRTPMGVYMLPEMFNGFHGDTTY